MRRSASPSLIATGSLRMRSTVWRGWSEAKGSWKTISRPRSWRGRNTGSPLHRENRITAPARRVHSDAGRFNQLLDESPLFRETSGGGGNRRCRRRCTSPPAQLAGSRRQEPVARQGADALAEVWSLARAIGHEVLVGTAWRAITQLARTERKRSAAERHGALRAT